MELVMLLKNKFIGSLPLCAESVSLPGYIGKMKRELERKYRPLITRANVLPEFLVVKGPQEDEPSKK